MKCSVRCIISFVFVFVTLFFFGSLGFAKTYQWEDYRKPFKGITKGFSRGEPTQIEVVLPDFSKNYESVPLIVEIEVSRNVINRPILIVNNFFEHPYRIDPYNDRIIAIRTEHLKSGNNIFAFHNDVYITVSSDISRLQFDIPELKKHELSIANTSAGIKKPKEQPKPIIVKDTTPPTVNITSHDTSRGIKITEGRKKVRISGSVRDANGIVEVIVNGKEAVFDISGKFYADIYLSKGKNKISVAAMDRYENRAYKTFTIVREDTATVATKVNPELSTGNYYALIIGNDNYQYIRKLETAKKDAEAVNYALKTKYNFKTELVLDATRNDIVEAINNYRRRLTPNDQLLIYYAGHGEFNKLTGKAYWLPIDAKSDSDTNWILADRITSNIKIIPSKHILIVSDSCYSGTFTRRSVTDLSTTENRTRYLHKMQTKKSRTLLASGGNEPVSDIGGGDHSVFAKAFISGLQGMEQKEFTAEELYYQHIKEMVAGSSEQTPEYNIIRNSGHEGGDFVFMRVD